MKDWAGRVAGFRCLSLCLFLCLMLCLTVAPPMAAAAPGDQTLFVNPDPEARRTEEDFWPESFVQVDGVFFAKGTKQIFRWQEGMEAPEPYCALPEYPEGYWESYEKASPDLQKQLDELVTQVAAGDGKLWAFNNYAGRIGEITEAGVKWLDVELDMTDMTSVEGAENYVRQRMMTYCQVIDGGFYCLRDNYSEERWADNRTLVRFDIATGAQTQVELAYAQMVTPYKAGQLLAFGSVYDEKLGESVARFTAVDLASGAETDIPYAPPEGVEAWNVGGLAYDEATDTLYCTGNKQIWKSEAGGPFAVVAYLTRASVYMNTPGWVLPSGLYAVGVEGDGLYVRNVDPQYKAERALRIGGGWEDTGYMRFISRYPDIPVLLSYTYYHSADMIAQEITGGDTQTDIYVLSVKAGLRDLIDKGFAADLSESETLLQDVAAMYPQAQAALSDAQGRPMAYPRIIDGFNPWSINYPLWEKFDMGPLPTTYAQFFDYMLRWQQEFAEDNPDIAFLDGSYDGVGLTEVVLRNYILQYEEPGKPIDFNSPLLRQTLELVAQLELQTYDYENMTEDEWQAYQELHNRPAIFSMYSRTGMYYDPNVTAYVSSDPDRQYNSYEFYRPLLPMVFEEGQTPMIRVGMDVMIVNPTSSNIDLALQYLEFFATEGMDHYARYALHPDMNEPVERKGFDVEVQLMKDWREDVLQQLQTADGLTKRDLEDSLNYLDRWLAEEEQNKWDISPGGIANYRELAEHMNFAENSLFFRQVDNTANVMLSDLLTRFGEGQLPLDAFLRELDSKARMIVMEGQ